MTIFEWLQLLAENIWLYGGSFILVLSILVFIHEWGHYIVARMCGVRVESFSIGFGKEIFGFTDKNKTRWKFSMIPLGGYVKLFGDIDPASAGYTDKVDDEDLEQARAMTEEERKVAFFAQPVAARSAIVFAGPAINYIFAVIVLCLLYTFYGQPVTQPVAVSVMSGSAAEIAGFQPHDKIVKIDNIPIRRFEDIRREVMVGLDTERVFTVERDGETLEISAKPDKHEEEDRFGFKHTRGLLGIIGPGNAIDIQHITAVNGKKVDDVDQARAKILSLMGQKFSIELDRGEETDTMIISPMAQYNEALKDPEHLEYNYLLLSVPEEEIFIKYNIVQSFAVAIEETITITTSTLGALGQMITGTRSATELGGIIRIGAIAGDMAQSGFIALVTFTALLSINLGLINLFPIPMLDGGHLVFYIMEALRGQPVSEQIQEYAFRMGLVILVGIMLFANINDIMQLIL